jgi:hypothetical protein
MKYLTLLPFLLAAAMVVPRAHAAAYTAIDNEPSTYTTALVCLLLILLANGRSRSDSFRHQDEDK